MEWSKEVPEGGCLPRSSAHFPGHGLRCEQEFLRCLPHMAQAWHSGLHRWQGPEHLPWFFTLLFSKCLTKNLLNIPGPSHLCLVIALAKHIDHSRCYRWLPHERLHFFSATPDLAVILIPLLPNIAATGTSFYLYSSRQNISETQMWSTISAVATEASYL